MYEDTEALSNANSLKLEEVAEAINKLGTQSTPFLWHGPANSNSDMLDPNTVVSKIRYVTQTAPTARGFRQPYPLTETEKAQMTVFQFEEDLWNSFGLKGTFVPDELLKECQKRLYAAQNQAGPSSTSEIQDLRNFLNILDSIHQGRKVSSTFQNRAGPNIPWTSLRPIPPDQFKKNIKSSFGMHFWALIIGNDNYPTNPLNGCINDGMIVKEYLEEYLGVPNNHIRFLIDATRQEIVDKLYDLRDAENIIFGDNILIHFSGHGTSYDSKQYFTTFIDQAGSIEGICPIDRGPFVPDISDRELNAILHELKIAKGSNITFFLDCCRAGGGLRSHTTEPKDRLTRYTQPLRTNEHTSDLQAMIEAADTNPRRYPDTLLTSSASWVSRMGKVDGFVQLAGCHDFQAAKEGIFQRVSFDSTSNPSSLLPSHVHERLEEHEVADYVPERGPSGINVKVKPKPKQSVEAGGRMSLWNGCFTWALINVLKSAVGQLGTYEGVIEHIGGLDKMQNPIAIGERKKSRLWFGNHLVDQSGRPRRNR